MLSKSDFYMYREKIYKEGFQAGVTAAIEVVQTEFGSKKSKKIFTKMLKATEGRIVQGNGK